MTQETLAAVFGWMAVINIAYLTLATLAIVGAQNWMIGIHKSLFDLPDADLKGAYFKWLATYKTLTMVLTVVPYIALKLA